MGTVHINHRKDRPLTPLRKLVAENCARIFFETAPSEVGSDIAGLMVTSAGSLPRHQTLWHVIDADLRQHLDENVKRKAVRDRLASMKPWLASLHLSQELASRLGLSANSGLERRLENLAVLSRKKIGNLEPLRSNLFVMEKLSSSAQQDFLRDAITAYAGDGSDLKKIKDAWLAGDEPYVSAYICDNFADAEDLRKLILDDRNGNWLPVILKALENQREPTLIVCGVAHFYGENNLRSLLTGKGYTIAPVTSARDLPRQAGKPGRVAAVIPAALPAAQAKIVDLEPRGQNRPLRVGGNGGMAARWNVSGSAGGMTARGPDYSRRGRLIQQPPIHSDGR